MRKEKISESQAHILIITFIMGTSLALTSFSTSKQNTWISVLIALVLATPIVLIYGIILNDNPDKDIFQILQYIFGKVIGFLYTFYFFHLGAISVRNMTEYIQVTSLSDTPQYITAIFIGLLTIYVLKCGLEVIARLNKFVFPGLIFIIGITIIAGISSSDVSNFLPILEDGWLPVIGDDFSKFPFPLGETVIFLAFLNSVKEKDRAPKIYLKGIFIGTLILLIAIMRNILALGFPSLSSAVFPSYDAVSLINIGNIKGIGIIISFVITIAGFIKVSVCLLASSIGVARVFNLGDYKWVSAPVGLFMMSFSFIIYDSTMHMIEWIDIYKYYALPFLVILPILIFVISKIKKSRHKKIQEI